MNKFIRPVKSLLTFTSRRSRVILTGVSATAGFVFFLGGCQSRPIKSFDEIRAGMDKPQVLDIAGSPRFQRRQKGIDRWVYVFEDRSRPTATREVQFTNGRATYVGKETSPVISGNESEHSRSERNRDEERLDEELIGRPMKAQKNEKSK